jgi:hypothetical protein
MVFIKYNGSERAKKRKAMPDIFRMPASRTPRSRQNRKGTAKSMAARTTTTEKPKRSVTFKVSRMAVRSSSPKNIPIVGVMA